MNRTFHFGVDVGTSSVRVGLFDQLGSLIDLKVKDIGIFHFQPDFYEQSSDDIWDSICHCFKEILKSQKPPINLRQIKSIGFDATCSLVVLDAEFKPLTVSSSKNKAINVIMWMDHRAKKQAEFINNTNHERLRSVGGSISVEMDPPKILWLKENLYDECYAKAAHFFSLPDYLVWRCTQKNIRSICCTTCKWLFKYDSKEKKWDPTFWYTIGLGDLVENSFAKIGSLVENPFKFVNDLTIDEVAARDLGDLALDVKVGVSMIDAHACSIGALAVAKKYSTINRDLSNIGKLEEILVIVSGTSACLMASSKEPKFINGIWGPYFEAMLPNLWLNEAGQSACGQLIHHIVSTHPAYSRFDSLDKRAMFDEIHTHLNDLASKNNLSAISLLTKHVHIYPDFHGNRSPLADPNLKGAICGLTLDLSEDDLCIKYLACLQAISYQTKHIIAEMAKSGLEFKLIKIIGGLASNQLYCQLISDITKLPVLISSSKSDSIGLLGTSILGASNTSDLKYHSIDQLFDSFATSYMDEKDLLLIKPNSSLDSFHDKKYRVYLKMIDDQKYYEKLMHN